MITSIFKNDFLSYLTILVIAIFLWGIKFYEVTTEPSLTVDLAGKLYNIPWKIGLTASFVVVILSGFFLSFKIRKYLFSFEPSNLFLLFYVLIVSVGITPSNCVLLSVISLLLVNFVNYLLCFVDKKQNESQVFNSSFVIGLLLFSDLLFILLVPLLIQNLSAIKRISFREMGMIFIGVLLPFVLFLLLANLTDNDSAINWFFDYEFIPYKVPKMVVATLFILFIICVKGYRLVITKRMGIDINTILLTRNMFVYLLFSIVLGVLSLFSLEIGYLYIIIAIPFSIFLANYFSNSTWKFKELLLILTLIGIFYLRM